MQSVFPCLQIKARANGYYCLLIMPAPNALMKGSIYDDFCNDKGLVDSRNIHRLPMRA